MEKKRIHYLSVASVCAACAMLMLHTNGCFWSFSKARYWDTANIIESVMYFAVPVFYMISGATLMDYRNRYTTFAYLKKRILKTVIPFFIWSLFGIGWAVSNDKFSITYDWAGVQTITDAVFQTSVMRIFWFFIPLFRIYLLIPLVSLVKEQDRKRIYIPLSIILFIVDFVFCNIALEQGMHRTEIDKSGLYMSYVLAGYLIHKYEMPKRWRYVLYVLAFVGLMVHMGATYVLSYEAGGVVQTWKGYANIPCVLYSIGIFTAFKQIGQKLRHEKLISIFEVLSQYTFAAYLIHWFILDYMVDTFSIDERSILYRVGAPIVVYGVCIVITWCMRKIPVLRRSLP